MRQIYTVATLIRMYSVHTASVHKPVLYEYIPVRCTCVLLSFFLPRHGGWFPVVECLTRPPPLFFVTSSDQPEFGLLSLSRIVGKLFPLAAFCAHNPS
jgi:hypothetical protein